MNDSLNKDYDGLTELVRKYLGENNLSVHQQSGLEWVLVHLHTDMVKLHSTIKKAEELLRVK